MDDQSQNSPSPEDPIAQSGVPPSVPPTQAPIAPTPPQPNTTPPPIVTSPSTAQLPDLSPPPAVDPNKPKKKKLMWLLALIVIIVAAVIVGLSLPKHKTPQVSIPDAHPTLLQNPKTLTDAHNAFGFNILRALGAQDTTQNVFISPASIALDLSMVYNGAGGTTKSAMTKTLQFQNLSTDQVNKQSLSLINALKTPDPDVTLSIADSAWVRQSFPINPTFSDTVSSFYDAKVSNLDFNSPDAAQTINNWVSTNTHGKISSIVNNIQPSDELFLINATYFKGSWTNAFDPSQTQTKTFTPTTGSAIKVPMMMQKQNNFSYLQTKAFQSVSLPYGSSERYSMDIFLPNNLTSFMNQLTISQWNQWTSQYQDEQGTLLLPRFQLTYSQELEDALSRLGMGVAFAPQANLDGIANNLQISSVLHESYVNVDEQGTEAAAATSTDVETGAVANPQPPKTFYMNVNRPFFFAITDSQTNEVLFSGVVENP